jgi:hypothetical protein
MNANQPELLWTPEIARRTKAQVLQEEWGVPDVYSVYEKRAELGFRPLPPLEAYTKLRSRPLSLFYQAPSCPPIPSMEEIRNVTPNNCLHANNGNHLVSRLGATVVKHGCSASILEVSKLNMNSSLLHVILKTHQEAENLLFLAEKRPNLRIPTVLAIWSTTEEEDIENPVFCLMMEFIEGIPLGHDVFQTLPICVQDTICAKVSSQLRYLRELPSEGYYGRVHKQAWLYPPTGIKSRTYTSPATVGPFETYEEFVSAIRRAEQVQRAVGYTSAEWLHGHKERTAKLMAIFPDWEPHEPKFTWVDPKLTNMIAQKITREDGSEDWEVFLLDWEVCAWYPAWVQGMQVMARSGVLTRNPTKPFKPTFYRKPEITSMIRKDFDPDTDQERLDVIRKENFWTFY